MCTSLCGRVCLANEQRNIWFPPISTQSGCWSYYRDVGIDQWRQLSCSQVSQQNSLTTVVSMTMATWMRKIFTNTFSVVCVAWLNAGVSSNHHNTICHAHYVQPSYKHARIANSLQSPPEGAHVVEGGAMIELCDNCVSILVTFIPCCSPRFCLPLDSCECERIL